LSFSTGQGKSKENWHKRSRPNARVVVYSGGQEGENEKIEQIKTKHGQGKRGFLDTKGGRCQSGSGLLHDRATGAGERIVEKGVRKKKEALIRRQIGIREKTVRRENA